MWFKKLVIILVLAVITECFICNFRFFQTFGNSGMGGYGISYGSGVIAQEDGTYYLSADGDRQIEITNINQILHNIKIDIVKENVNGDINDAKYQSLPIRLKAKDDANAYYFSLPEKIIVKDNERSKYITLNLSGVVPSLIIDLGSSKDCYISVNEIAVNTEIPFEFILLRCLCILIIYALVWTILDVRFWRNIKLDLRSPIQNCVTAFILVVQLTLLCFLGNANSLFNDEAADLHNGTLQAYNYIYYALTEAIDEGKVYIDAEVDERLINMENPYDRGMRESLGVNFKWDYAFYEGKYYVYFGVVPVLLVYLPYYKIIGEHIANSQVLTIGIVFACVLLMLLLRKLASKYAPKLPLPILYMLYLVSSNAIGCAFMISIPSFYSVPIIYAIAFTLAGLYLWLCAEDSIGMSRYMKMFGGAICMALVAGCRPQFLIASFLFIPIIGWGWIDKLKKKEKREVINDLVAVAIPYLLIAIGLMYYNAVRFGSPFDFGANYNLTTNDMTHRGWKWDRAGLGLFYYLFNSVRFGSSFPFITPYNVETVFQGRTISESMYGGAFSICPFVLIGIYTLFIPGLYSEKKNYAFHAINIISAIIIVVVDTQMAGILYRYMADFMLFLLVPSCIAVMIVFKKTENNSCYAHCWRIFMCMMMCSLIIYHMMYFAPEYRDLSNMNPALFYRIANAVQIWL